MVGKIVLHSWMKRGIGLGFPDLPLFSPDKRVLYVNPSANLLPELQRKLAIHNRTAGKVNDRINSWPEHVEFATFDQLTRRLLPVQKRRLMLQEEQEWLIRQAAEEMVQQGKLIYFADVIQYPGWVRRMAIWIGEVKRAGISEEKLVALWNGKERKYQELAELYSRYQTLLTRYELMDHEEAYRLLLADTTSDLPDVVIFEHFADLTPLQLMVISHLCKRGTEVHFHLLYDPAREDRLFARTRQTINRLSALGFTVEQAGAEPAENRQEQPDQVLQHVQKFLFAPSFPERIQAEGQIRLLRAADMEKECRMVAAHVKRLIREQQISPGQIAIITANPEHDLNLLHDVFREAKIPLALAKREYLHKLPLMQTIFSLLQAGMGDKEAFISLLHSPYLPGKQSGKQLFPLFRQLGYPMSVTIMEERWEKLIRSGQNLPGPVAHWAQAREVLRGLLHLLEQVPRKATAGEFADWLLSMLSAQWNVDQLLPGLWIKDRCDRSDRTANHSSPDKPAEQHWQYYNRDVRAIQLFRKAILELAQVSRLSDNGQPVSLSTFLYRLRRSCEEKQVVYWEGPRHGVNVLHPNALRGQRFNTVFIMGLTDGGFPRIVRNDWLMPDEVRRELRRQGFVLPLTRDYALQQEWQFFQGVAAAERRLYLSYSTVGGDGTEYLPSPFLQEIAQMIDSDTLLTETWEVSLPVPAKWEDCLTAGDWKEKILLGGHDLPASWDDRGVMQRIAIERRRLFAPWDAYDGLLEDAVLRENISGKLSEMIWSPTQLNQLVKCRHAFFNRYILKLNAWREEEETLLPQDRGNLFHTVLYRFFSGHRGENLSADKREIYRRELLDIFAEESERFARESGFPERNPALWPVEKRRLSAQLLRILEHELYWRECSGGTLRPAYLELSFGLSAAQGSNEYTDPASVEEAARIPLGREILRLRGKIDRVDIAEQGYFVVYDYKSGLTATSSEVRQGLHLQLPLYLQVLVHHFGLEQEKMVGAAFYTAGNGDGKQDNRNTGMWHEERMGMAGISRSLRNAKIAGGEWDSQLAQINDFLHSQLQLAKQGDFTVRPNGECPAYCEFRRICRYDKERAQRKEEKPL